MAARQIPEYTEAQLARELTRTAAKAEDAEALHALDTDDFISFFQYAAELRAEDLRRAPLRAAAPAPDGWTINLPSGRNLRQERVA